ncbi:helix-turn-helix domain-containing protein [Sciscionella marina]|uniref:helix-turn-helix domain-containing protein n=1 Tax=Sciscionella marina TaxID=508770 RepID=UPI000362EBE9|nr:helix-turn-helix transcriptional regulator [Sciscionella marina]
MAQQQLPPAVMKIVLGNELARQRVEAGLKQDDAAGVLRCTQQKIAHIESGSGIRPMELDALLERYGASETDQAYARDLQAEGNRRTKRGAFSTRFRQHMRLLVDMEPSCQRFFSYQSMVVPGLLQTEQYMRTLFRAWRPSPSQEQIDRDTSDRLARQRVLDNTDQQFWFIIDEAALRRTTGSAGIVKEQVMWLVEALDRPNVELQIVPFATGYYMGQGHDYSIFGYDTRPPVSIVYLEQHDGGTYVDDSKRTTRYLTLWEQQKAAASGPEQTRRFLLDLAGTL